MGLKITPRLEAYLETNVSGRSRRKGWIGVTDMYDMCPRQVALSKNRIRYGRTVSCSERVNFDLGHAIHNLVYGYLDAIGELVGIWICRQCSHDRSIASLIKCTVKSELLGILDSKSHLSCQFGKRPLKSCSCGCNDFIYHETWVEFPDMKIEMHVDAWVERSQMLVPVDVKSISTGQFKSLTYPLERNIHQISMYCQLAKGFCVKVADYGILLYVSKNDAGISFPSPFKEFHVERDRRAVQKTIRALKSCHSRTLPPRELCSHQTDTRAVKCAERYRCFKEAS